MKSLETVFITTEHVTAADPQSKIFRQAYIKCPYTQAWVIFRLLTCLLVVTMNNTPHAYQLQAQTPTTV